MNWWKDVLARFSKQNLKARKSPEGDIEETRTGSQDRAFLATKQGQLDQPPYASLRQ